MADWTLNELTKVATKTYTAGSPGVSGDPGQPYVPAYCYWMTVGSNTETIHSPLAPEGSDYNYGTYTLMWTVDSWRYFDGRKAYLRSIIGGAENTVYIYEARATTSSVQVCLPEQQYIPPTIAVPATPDQIAIDYRFGWNSGATGPAPLAVGKAITWRFPGSVVGAAVGVTSVFTPQGQTYTEMEVAVIAQGGLYVVMLNRVNVSGFIAYADTDEFAIVHNVDNISVYVNSVLKGQLSWQGELVADSSMYSAGDRILDAQEVTLTLPSLPTSTKSDLQATGRVTRTFGTGTANGIVGWSTRTDQVVGSVMVNGTAVTAIGMTTASDLQATGVRTRAAAGQWATASNLQATPSYAYASLSLEALAGSSAGPDVFVGWTGTHVGSAVEMLPMTAAGDSGLFIPISSIGDMAMIPMTATGFGVTGGTTSSSTGTMMPMIALGAEADYGMAEVAFPSMWAFGDDGELTGGASLSVTFSIIAEGQSAAPNSLDRVVRNIFTVTGYGGGYARMEGRFMLTASASSPGIGTLTEAMGYV